VTCLMRRTCIKARAYKRATTIAIASGKDSRTTTVSGKDLVIFQTVRNRSSFPFFTKSFTMSRSCPAPLNSGFLRYYVFVNKFGGIDAVQDQILGSLDSDLLKLFENWRTLTRDFKETQDKQATYQQQTRHIYPFNLQPR